MIRWSYLLPRVLLLLTLLTAAHYAIPLVLRWGMIRAIETATGTQADVRQAWASLARGEVRIGDLQIARSELSDRNLFQCDSATLALNLNALAHQRLVVDEAQIRGIRWNAPRRFDATGAAHFSLPTPDMSQLARSGGALSRRWLDDAARMLQRRVEDEFPSLQTARQMAERWPQEYRDLQQQVRQCHQSALQLYETFTATPPASEVGETLSQLQQRWQDVVGLRQRISQLQERLAQLARQIERDRVTIAAAFAADREKLLQTMSLARLDDQRLDSYLLDSEIHQWWTRLQPWLEFAQWLNESPEMNELGHRGTVVPFTVNEALPTLLLRSATLDGQICLAGHEVSFLGQACDWAIGTDSSSPRPTTPARLHLVTQGSFLARLDLQLDSVDGVPRRQIALQCDSMPLAARSWGHESGWTVAVAPGTAQIRARLTATGDSLDGRIQLIQNEIQLTVTPGAGGSLDTLWPPLAQAANGIDHFELSAAVTGQVGAPQWEIESNLGRQLQQRFQTALEQILCEQTERLVAEANHRLQTQIKQWGQQLPGQQAQLQQQLAATQQLLSTLAQPVASRFQPLGRLLQRF